MVEDKCPRAAETDKVAYMELRFEIVRPSELDVRQIMDWHNDPTTLAMSFHTKKKEWETYYSDFLRKNFAFPDLPPLFILVEGDRAAFVQFRPVAHPWGIDRRCCEISINVAPEYRGKGIGTAILKAIQPWVSQQGYDDILAQVKAENLVSTQAFSAAGFVSLGEFEIIVPDTEQPVKVFHFLANVSPTKKESKVFIVAEAGSNWHAADPKESQRRARQMIEAAKQAGADAVKFQVFRPETVYVPNAGTSDYLADAGIQEDISAIFEELSMPYEMISELAEHCQHVGIQFMASPFSISDFEAVDPYVSIHKIASYEISHLRLIEAIARTGKPIFLSTGASLEHEINWALETISKNGGGAVTLLQCTAKYPAPPHGMHLQAIKWLKERFKLEVGLSDHSSEPVVAPILAVAYGARVIEKHFTLDKKLTGPDHAFAVEPVELKAMVEAIRLAEEMKGSEVKIVDPCEYELRDYCKRGLQATENIRTGDWLHEGKNIGILRPGKQARGVHPRFLPEIEGKRAKHEIKIGSGLKKGDW